MGTIREQNPTQAIIKLGLMSKKVLLCVWWDWKGLIHSKLISNDQKLNADLYCQQLTRLKQIIDQKLPELANRKGIVFRELGWEV